MNVDILNRHSDFLVFSFLLPISLFSFLYFLGKESTFIFWFYYYYSDLSCSSIKLSPNQTKPKKVLVSPISVFSFISLKTLMMDCWYCLLYTLCFFCLSQFLRFMFLSWNVGSGSGSTYEISTESWREALCTWMQLVITAGWGWRNGTASLGNHWRHSLGFSSWAEDSSGLLPGGVCKITGHVLGRKFIVLAFSVWSMWSFALVSPRRRLFCAQIEASRLLLGSGGVVTQLCELGQGRYLGFQLLWLILFLPWTSPQGYRI